MKTSNSADKRRAQTPEFYMPAMWPLDLQTLIADWWAAWRWRRRMRRLLEEEARGAARLGGFRRAVEDGAQERLGVIAARFAERRRQGADE